MADLSGESGIIVIKIGSSTLVNASGGVDRDFIADLCAQVVSLREQGLKVVIVSSGAAAAGMERLGFASRPSDIPSGVCRLRSGGPDRGLRSGAGTARHPLWPGAAYQA